MRRTRMMLVAAVAAVSLSASGAGVALAQSPEDPELAEECGAMSFFEWLFFGHQCHGHGGGQVYWPRFF